MLSVDLRASGFEAVLLAPHLRECGDLPIDEGIMEGTLELQTVILAGLTAVTKASDEACESDLLWKRRPATGKGAVETGSGVTGPPFWVEGALLFLLGVDALRRSVLIHLRKVGPCSLVCSSCCP